jgi:serine/threonine protein kinase
MIVHADRPDQVSNAEGAGILAAGTQLGAYRIVRCIGCGGMGAVYEAEHSALQKRVAVKVPYLSGLSEEGRARFVQEGKNASRIRHPNVVDITDVGEAEHIAYLVMEYLEGQPLSELLDGRGRLGPQMIADIFVPVAAALHEAHRMGIVHRDLKPENILLTCSVHGSIQPKLLDFGISKLVDADASPALTSANTLLGTPRYLSPEQLQAPESVTAQSDQYSLGVVMYEAATGANPFAGHSSLVSTIKAVADGERVRARVAYPELDERLERIIERAMSISPAARFASMLGLGAELVPLASASTQSMWGGHFGSALPDRAPPLRHLQRTARWVAGSGVALLLGVAAVRVVVREHGSKPEGRPVQSAAGLARLDTSEQSTPRGSAPSPAEPTAPVVAVRQELALGGERPSPSPSARARLGKPPLAKTEVRPRTRSALDTTQRRGERAARSWELGSEPLPTDNIDPWQQP